MARHRCAIGLVIASLRRGSHPQPTVLPLHGTSSHEGSDGLLETFDKQCVSSLRPDSWAVSIRVGTRGRVCRGDQARSLIRCLPAPSEDLTQSIQQRITLD